MLELVMSGRSVSIGLLTCVHSSAPAVNAATLARHPSNAAISDRIELMPQSTARFYNGAMLLLDRSKEMNERNAAAFRVRHHFIAHENVDRMPCTVNRPGLEQLLHDWPLFDPFEVRHEVREFGSLGVICPGF
jgi:hypothetical protein